MARPPERGGQTGSSSRPRNAYEAIGAQASGKRQAAADAGGAGSYGAGNARPRPGVRTSPPHERSVAALGYTPGGFDDPNIDWQAIYNAFIAPSQPQTTSGAGGGYSSGNAMPGPAEAPAAPIYIPPPPVIETPQTYVAPPVVQPPAPVTSTASGVEGAPLGAAFETVGVGPGTFGSFERRRNARNPRQGLSVTPEMLRAAARSRLG